MPGYRLESGEPLASGLKRIATEQVDAALACLGGLEPDPDTAIHAARKRLKKVRSVLRLARASLDAETRRRENRFFGDVARRLAPFRDPRVRLDTLDELTAAFAGVLAHDAFADLRMQLLGLHRAALRALRSEAEVAPITAELAAARARIEGWPLAVEGFGPLALGLERAYRRGRKRMAEAYASPEPGRLHAWRRRVKDLWYQTRIVAPVWPAPMGSLAAELHDLGETLGGAHDLAELDAALAGLAPTGRRAREALCGLIGVRLAELRRSARGPGRRIYVEKAPAFAARVGAYGAAWLVEHPPDAGASRPAPAVVPLPVPDRSVARPGPA